MALRLVQVGLGGWGRDWAKNALPKVSAVETVARVDADPAALATARKSLRIPAKECFPTLDSALEAVPADAVVVTAPLIAHIPLTLAALAAGKHVLVEKPFAPSLAEARQAVELAEQRGLVLMVSQNYRHFPAPRAVAELVAGATLGPAGTVTVDFRRNVTAANGSARHFALPNALLMDMAIHHFDLMRLILGQEPLTVSCQTWNPPWSPFASDAAGSVTVTFSGGAVATWRGNWVSSGAPTAWGGEWGVECEEAEIIWTSRGENGGVSADRVAIAPRGGKPKPITLPTVEPHGRAGALAAFAAAISNGTPPETSGRDNLTTLAIALAAVESAATGRPVSLFSDP